VDNKNNGSSNHFDMQKIKQNILNNEERSSIVTAQRFKNHLQNENFSQNKLKNISYEQSQLLLLQLQIQQQQRMTQERFI
jgi:hypothetical protein